MRVGIYETVEVSDEQRALIAADLGQKTATRDDLKTWIWEKGRGWAALLVRGEVPEADTAEDEDLLGGSSEDEPDEDLLGDDDEDLI